LLATIGIQVQNTKYNKTLLVSTMPLHLLMFLEFHGVKMETPKLYLDNKPPKVING
jgi:hypothetical protein